MWRVYFLVAVVAVPALLLRGCFGPVRPPLRDGSDGRHFGRLVWDLSRSTTIQSIGWPEGVSGKSYIWFDIAHLTLTLPGGERFEFEDCGVFVNRRGNRVADLHVDLHHDSPRGAAAAIGTILNRLWEPVGENSLDEWAERVAGMERWQWSRSLGWERFPQSRRYHVEISYGDAYRNDPELVWVPQFGIVIE